MAVCATKSKDINEKLQVLYEGKKDAFISEWKKAFEKADEDAFMNVFGIVDVNAYDVDNGILFIAKETRGTNWNKENSFFEWLRGFVVGGKKVDTKHPQIWYNLGRWAKLIINPDMDIKTLADEKEQAISGLCYIAYTNINKIGGSETSGSAFWELAKTTVAREILREEIEVIAPQIIILCGKGLQAVIEGKDGDKSIWKGALVIEMPHPSARTISKKKMLCTLKDVLDCSKSFRPRGMPLR